MQEIKDLLKQLLKDQEEIYSLTGRVKEVDQVKRTCTIEPLDGSALIYEVRLQSSVSSDIGLTVFPKLESVVTVTFLSKELAYVANTDELEKIELKIGGLAIFVDALNIKTAVKTNLLQVDDHTVQAKNASFTVGTLFEIISAQQIKHQAINYLLQATNVEIEGITKITGATTILGTTNITGATTINGAATISGAVAMAAGLSVGTSMQIAGGTKGGVPISSEVVKEINKIKTDINNLKTNFNAWVPVVNDGGAALKAAVSTWRATELNPTTVADISNPNFTQ